MRLLLPTGCLVLREAVRWNRIELWAHFINETRGMVVGTWVEAISTEDHFGPMEKILAYAAGTGCQTLGGAVLSAIHTVMIELYLATSRLNEPEVDEVSDLVDVVTHFLDLVPLLPQSIWPLVGDIHPVHLRGVGSESIVRLLDHAMAHQEEELGDHFLDCLCNWIEGFGMGLEQAWKADIEPRLTDIRSLLALSSLPDGASRRRELWAHIDRLTQ